MQNEPQLSAEMERAIESRAHKVALATALEEQRLGYIAEVEKLIDNEEDDTTAWLYNSAINKVLAILNGKAQ